MKINEFRKRLLIIGAILILLIALPLTVFLVRQQQNLQQGAAGDKTLSLKPVRQQGKVGDTVTLRLVLKPGTTAVKYVKAVITYDHTKLTADDFTQDPGFKLNKTLSNFDQDKITLEFQSDQLADYIKDQTTLGTLTFHVGLENGSVDSSTIVGPAAVNFETTASSVKRADNQVVSYQFVGATVDITANNVCQADVSTCSWNSVDIATSYHYEVDETKDENGQALNPPTVIKGPDTTAQTSVTFNSVAGATYKCSVYAINDCGNGTPGTPDTKTCVTPSPTITLTPTLTPTVTLTPTETPTETPTSTPTSTPTNTPTPTTTVTLTSTPTNTPTPTTVISTATPTTFVPTATQVPGTTVTSTPVPTLPPTGNNVVTFGAILGAGLVVLGGLLLLIL